MRASNKRPMSTSGLAKQLYRRKGEASDMTRLSQYIPPLLFSHSISLLVLWRSIDRQITVECWRVHDDGDARASYNDESGMRFTWRESERVWAYLIEEFMKIPLNRHTLTVKDMTYQFQPIIIRCSTVDMETVQNRDRAKLWLSYSDNEPSASRAWYHHCLKWSFLGGGCAPRTGHLQQFWYHTI